MFCPLLSKSSTSVPEGSEAALVGAVGLHGAWGGDFSHVSQQDVVQIQWVVMPSSLLSSKKSLNPGFGAMIPEATPSLAPGGSWFSTSELPRGKGSASKMGAKLPFPFRNGNRCIQLVQSKEQAHILSWPLSLCTSQESELRFWFVTWGGGSSGLLKADNTDFLGLGQLPTKPGQLQPQPMVL